jgi:serine/threonine-protein phosphatase 2A regulatory subunit B''
MPFMEELLAFHPGLAFLETTPEFQEKYARTVIARIFYDLDWVGKRKIDSRTIRRSNLVASFHAVDLEDDINAIIQYFSYEHFYVLYCKFWELDTDHDFTISRADLSRMTEMTTVVLDRMFLFSYIYASFTMNMFNSNIFFPSFFHRCICWFWSSHFMFNTKSYVL